MFSNWLELSINPREGNNPTNIHQPSVCVPCSGAGCWWQVLLGCATGRQLPQHPETVLRQYPLPKKFWCKFQIQHWIGSRFDAGQQLGVSRGCFRWAWKVRKHLSARNLGWRLNLNPCNTSSDRGWCLLLWIQQFWVGKALGEHQGKDVSATASHHPLQNPPWGFGVANCSSLSCKTWK